MFHAVQPQDAQPPGRHHHQPDHRSQPAEVVVADGNTLRRVEPATAPDPSERRRSHRHAESASAWLSATGATASFHAGTTVAVNDLSLHGVGFTSHRPLEPGDRHWILIARGPMRLSTRVRVASCRPSPDGVGYEVGGEFY